MRQYNQRQARLANLGLYRRSKPCRNRASAEGQGETNGKKTEDVRDEQKRGRKRMQLPVIALIVLQTTTRLASITTSVYETD